MASRCRRDELVVEFGAGRGALTIPLAQRGARVIAIEHDPVWAHALKQRIDSHGLSDRVQVLPTDMLQARLPTGPYRVIASPPFNATTALLHRLLDDPIAGPARADLILQWEVARKRCVLPPRTLLSAVWAPWWEFELVRRVPKRCFRPIPRVDGAWLSITRRTPPILPPSMAMAYADFVRSRWPLSGMSVS